MAKTIAVILAGGKSSRMGTDKADLPLRGGTMLSHLVAVYSAAFDDVYVSGHSCENVKRLYDEYESAGPLAGLASAFTSTDADYVFLSAVDLPGGSAALAQKLVDLIGDFDACVIKRESIGIEPTFAVFGRSCLPSIIKVIEHGKRSIYEMLGLVLVRFVGEDELKEFDLDFILQNVNTPEDYENFMKMF